MNLDEAQKLLFQDVFSREGTFVLLRLGQNPGADRVVRLRIALRVLWRELRSMDCLPRDVAYACGILICFSSESYANLVDYTGPEKHHLELSVRDLVQGAFDVLAGENAETVRRPDLGE